MDKLTYLAELAEGLARWVPERERQDILRYYAEYFEEAGPDREAQVVQELGDPWALSCRLAVEGGYVTAEQANRWTPPKKKLWPWVLIGTAAVLVFIVGSVASAAAQIGRVVGQMVGNEPYMNEPYVAVVGEAVEGTVSAVDEATCYSVPMEQTGGVFMSVEGGSLEMFSAIDVDVKLANISVLSGDDYTLSIYQDTDLGGYGLDWEVKGGTLKLKDGGTGKQIWVNSWDEFKELFGGSEHALEVTITVPEGAMLDKIDVKTGLGNVTLWGVYAAKMAAETGLGDVECYEPMQVKELDLETGLGDIILDVSEPYSGLEIDLESGLGDVDVYLGCLEEECGYQLEGVTGGVIVDGAYRGSKVERKGDTPYKLDAESGLGEVSVDFY